jgi:hypothetical protein
MYWHNAFFAGNAAIAREIAIHLEQEFGYEVVVSGGRIHSVESDEGDYICHRDDYDDDQENLEQFVDCISSDVYMSLDVNFGKKGGGSKKKLIIGAKTIMPFPKLQGVHS